MEELNVKCQKSRCLSIDIRGISETDVENVLTYLKGRGVEIKWFEDYEEYLLEDVPTDGAPVKFHREVHPIERVYDNFENLREKRRLEAEAEALRLKKI